MGEKLVSVIIPSFKMGQFIGEGTEVKMMNAE
jgi:hypothetical protein